MTGKLISTSELKLIYHLRQTGHSILEIAIIIKRSPASIVKLVKNVDVLPKYVNVLKSKRGGSAIRAIKRREAALSEAEKLITGALSERDKLLISACLYWGEGTKREFSFTNSDPLMILTLMSCLLSLGLDISRVKVSIRLYESSNIASAKKYWAKVAGISPKNITSINILEGKKFGKLPYGMCRIRITKGIDYFNLMTSTIELVRNKLPL